MKKDTIKAKQIIKDKRIYIRVTEIELKAIKKVAEKENISISELVLKRIIFK
jgi:hypothetical protein